jgi:glycosyltransferase involved in cell wall biosynthesis
VLSRADALICLSEQAAAIYRRFGGEHLPVHVIPNGIDLPGPSEPAEPNGRWLVVSRLTPEKGVRELVEIWPESEALDVIGSGPGLADIAARAQPTVALLGPRDRFSVLAAMPGYQGLVFPSRCLEMQPTVLAEALAACLPVVALSGSAGSSVVDAGGGTTYDDAASLLAALESTRARRAELGARAREVYDRHFRRSAWIDALLWIYSGATRAS